MKYRCETCGALQVRGFFPAKNFHIRWALFHGIALGISSIFTKLTFSKLGYAPTGWRGALLTLAVCAALLCVIYAIAVFIEQLTVATRGCVKCHSHRLATCDNDAASEQSEDADRSQP